MSTAIQQSRTQCERTRRANRCTHFPSASLSFVLLLTLARQVYIFYGPRPNSDLLLHAGFVYENNRFDALAIRVRLAPDAEHIKDKLRLLHLNNMKMYPLPSPLFSLRTLALGASAHLP